MSKSASLYFKFNDENNKRIFISILKIYIYDVIKIIISFSHKYLLTWCSPLRIFFDSQQQVNNC